MFIQQATLYLKLAAIVGLGLIGLSANAFKEGTTRPLHLLVSDKQMQSTASTIWWSSGLIIEPGTRFLQFGFILDSLKSDAKLIIRDSDDREISAINLREIPIGALRRTPIAPVEAVKLSIEAPARPENLKLRIVSKSFEVDSRTEITAQSAMLGWSMVNKDTPLAFDRMSGIAKLRFANDAVCTGFLIRSNLLATALHCISLNGAADDCGAVNVIFDYLDRNSKIDQARCVKIAYTLKEYDLTVLQVQFSSNSPSRFHFDSVGTMQSSGDVWLLHHPAGLPLLQTNKCRADKVGVVIKHDCSTLGGSSGAPILDQRGTLVGIHTNGIFDDDKSPLDLIREYDLKSLADARNSGFLVEPLRAIK